MEHRLALSHKSIMTETIEDDRAPKFHFREWRKFREKTQEDLASEVGLSASSISQLETGKQGFTGDTLIAFARALNCHPGELLLCNPLDPDGFWHLFRKAEALKGLERKRMRDLMETNLKYGAAG
jgi:transcriptional regulator with XRE-family HTH domain